jgi:GMC oxidoreductase/FAD binding domain
MKPESASLLQVRSERSVCVIGSGPAGMVLALELARLGCAVTLVESGLRCADERAQRLSDADRAEEATHAPMADAVMRRWGGTSHLWGGRCVPLDPLDFETREQVRERGWPISFEEISAYYPMACEYADCGGPRFSIPQSDAGAPPLAEGFVDGDVRSDQLERWCAAPVLVSRLGQWIDSHPQIDVKLGATCVGIDVDHDGRRVIAARLVDTVTSKPQEPVRADCFMLACGGVESTRLLLHFADQVRPPRMDGLAWLGRGYMGHISGKIATVKLSGDPKKTVFGFERDGCHCVRRRFTLAPDVLRQRGLLNIAMWLDNPAPADPAHRSGILSAAYLALRSPLIGPRLAAPAIRKSLLARAPSGSLLAHLANLVRAPLSSAEFVALFAWQRYYAYPRLPGFFACSPANVYALHYHAEQSPWDESRVELAQARDAHGVRRARLSLRFRRSDAQSIVEAHRVLDEHLRSHGIGTLEYAFSDDALVDAVSSQARDGFHQLGTARMSTGPGSGVCDSHGRVFGMMNLFVSGSALFPTSGQANPTLTILALAIRQASHIAHAMRETA